MKRSRKSPKKLGIKSKKSKSLFTCDPCSKQFSNKKHFLLHLKDTLSCRQALSSICCSFCDFVSINKSNDGLLRHRSQNKACDSLFNQMKSTEGFIPPFDSDLCFESSEVAPDKSVISQYRATRVSANLAVDQVLINLKDTTEAVRSNLTPLTGTVPFKDVTQTMSNNRLLAGYHNNSYSHPFQNTEVNYDFNNRFEDEDNDEDNDESVDSSSSVDTNVENGNNDEYDDESVDSSSAGNGVLSDTIIGVDPVPRVEVSLQLQTPFQDIRDKERKMLKHFSNIIFLQKDEILMDLFHLLKASNAPLIMFDRIIE